MAAVAIGSMNFGLTSYYGGRLTPEDLLGYCVAGALARAGIAVGLRVALLLLSKSSD